MPLSSRNLIVACSFACVCLLSAAPVRGQSNFVQPNYQTDISAYQPNQIIDHSSMSPDSWSAPPATNTIPYAAPRTTLPYSAPANGAAPTQLASPSIPDLGIGTSKRAPQQTQQADSLIRQPEATGIHPAGVSQSPFRSAKHSQGLPTASPQDGQATPANPFRATAGNLPNSPQVPGAATRGFAPATNSTLAPTSSSPVVGGGVVPTAPGRYPLGLNSKLPSKSQTNEFVTDAPPTYHSLLNQPLTTQPRSSSYFAPGTFGSPVVTQPQPQPNFVAPQSAPSPQTLSSPTFRPDLGHRSPTPTFRGRDHDSGLKLDFEDKKKQYPGLGEILATGRYFGSVSTLFLQPAFQQNSVITQFNSSAAAATFASSESFDFDYETAPRLRVGFESEFGPGVELDYWQFDQGSNVSAFTSNGLNSGQLSSGLFGPSSLTTLTAVNAGDTLSAIHSIDIETFSITFFKEIKFPISRLNGIFGFQYASVFQSLDAELTDAAGNLTGAIRSTSDLRAYGPKLKFEYYRPVGHTKLEFVTAFGGSVLFGERDQFVTNTGAPAVNRLGADEYVLTSDFYGGVQWKKLTAENRGYYVRVGVTHQSWIGGGSAVSSESNFGLRGFAFEVGINR